MGDDRLDQLRAAARAERDDEVGRHPDDWAAELRGAAIVRQRRRRWQPARRWLADPLPREGSR